MKTCVNTALDPTLRSSDAQNFEVSLRRKIVGQDPAIEKVAEIYKMFLATLTLGDNRRVDLSQCMIFMTSNLGAGEMNDLIHGGLGFAQKPGEIDAKMDEKLTRTAVDAARRKFSPEFMNRIDKTVVFNMLRPIHLEQILEIELGMVQQRILQATGNSQFVFSCTQPMKRLLL